MKYLEFLCISFLVGNAPVVAIKEETPEFLQEAVDSVNSLGIPRLALLDRSEEHFVETQGIGAVSIAYEVRIDDVVHTLAHLFYCPAADILSILEFKLRIGKFRSPGPEGIDIQLVVVYDIDIDMDFGGFVFVLEAI